MITSWQAVRTGRLAASCAICAAILCAVVSVVVGIAALLDHRGGPSTTSAGGVEYPLIATSACETDRARSILASTAERDVRWRDGDATVRWGEWRVTVGAGSLPVRVLIVVVNPLSGRWGVTKPSPTARQRWTLADAAEGTRVAVGIDEPVSIMMDSAVSAAAASEILAAMPASAQLFADNGRIARTACGPATLPGHTARTRRVALGVRDDGAVLFVLAHFDGVGEAASLAPLGTTVPEFASIMHALGARRGAILATGTAAQLLVRPTSDATARRWPGDAGTHLGLILHDELHAPRVNAGDLVSRQ